MNLPTRTTQKLFHFISAIEVITSECFERFIGKSMGRIKSFVFIERKVFNFCSPKIICSHSDFSGLCVRSETIQVLFSLIQII
jgi:hypothetical protein